MTALAPPAVAFRGRRCSSEEVVEIAARWRAFVFEELGELPGCMAVAVPNSPEAIALLFALSSFPVPLIVLSPDPRAWQTAPSLPVGTPLVLLPELASLAIEVERRGLRATVLPGYREIRHPGGGAPPFLVSPGFVLFTSGSTGPPRPVYRTTGRLLAAVDARNRALRLPPGGGILGTLPLSRGYGLNGMLGAALLGARLGLLPHFDHTAVLPLFASGEYDYWAGTPAMANILVRCPARGRTSAPAVCVIAGGVAPSVFRGFVARFGVPLRQTYGTTETGLIAVDTAPANQVRSDAVGRPVPGAEVRIGEGPHDALPPGRSGRVWVKSGWCMEGYGFPPYLEPRLSVDGWWRTEDVGRLNDDGTLTLEGRVDDCVKTSAGHLVNLTEIAGVLVTYPGVTDVAVVPLGDSPGPAIGALVESGAPVSVAELREHVARALPPWCQPRVVAVTRELPRLPGGKADRLACVATLEGS